MIGILRIPIVFENSNKKWYNKLKDEMKIGILTGFPNEK